MKKTLYLMRHGQTLFNVEHKIQGWCDSPLTEQGIKQAEIAARYFDDNKITFDHCYASTSERACDTLEIVTHHKYPYTRVKGLKEWNFGRFEAMDEFLNPQLPHGYGDFFVQYGGESQQQVTERMVKTLTEIMEKEDHHDVLALSHGGACFFFVRAFDDYNAVIDYSRVGNCTIFKLVYEDGIFSCVDIIQSDFSEIENI
ncbi:histidine phosphatase family protein [Sharpea azabuensis]|uniref:histidine phosphatase family protein n=1 Tax=Sharpea azabuensis TaxID=322505 RepID=UPI0024096524|nr:histidine phosphatase family protein [Sharpea azabuensis]MDD6513093.1 phosphoglycerate mutase family protein [Sharpea azabuensis]